MAEIFKSLEQNPSVSTMRGFYVMRMKKDQRTGHYVGVATWIPRNQPIPGGIGVPHAPEPPQQKSEAIQDHPVPASTPFSQQETERLAQPTQVEDSRSEFNQIVEKFNVQRKPSRTSVYDPYDSYEL